MVLSSTLVETYCVMPFCLGTKERKTQVRLNFIFDARFSTNNYIFWVKNINFRPFTPQAPNAPLQFIMKTSAHHKEPSISKKGFGWKTFQNITGLFIPFVRFKVTYRFNAFIFTIQKSNAVAIFVNYLR